MQLFRGRSMFLIYFFYFFAHENMKKTASKVAHNRLEFFFQYCQSAQIQPRSQFLFHKNLQPREFSIITLVQGLVMRTKFLGLGKMDDFWLFHCVVVSLFFHLKLSNKYFFNFSCMFLNSNNLFQFEL